MKFYEVKTTINATPEQIWPIMSDGPGFTAWDSSVVGFEGNIANGEKVVVTPQRMLFTSSRLVVMSSHPGRAAL